MKCIECGREIEDNKKFCKYCGAPVKQQSDSAEKLAGATKCQGCGATLKPGAAFCTQCGSPVSKKSNSNVNVPVKTDKPKKSGNKAGKIIIAVITIIAILLIGFIGYYFANQYGLFNKDVKEPREKIKTSSESAADTQSASEDETTSEDVSETTTSMTDDVIDVEELVLEIRGKYDKITNGIASNSYDAVIVDDGVMAYADQNKICAIVVKKGYDNSDYTRYFYYDGDDLFFAYYEGDDSHRLYFDNGKLYRWRYCADASNNSKATNYDQENTTEYRRWETDVLNDSNQFKSLCDDAIENGVATQDYVLPGSDMRYVSKEELKDFTADQCRLARNELYARHGRIFDDEFLQTYFSSKDWYSPSIATADFKESMLNEYEIANRDLIVEYEKERGYR